MRILVSALLVTCVLAVAQGQTATGPVTSDTSWTTPVTVTGTVTITAGHTLTIQPGVVVQFNSGTSLVIAGAINANGTSGSPITFTSSAGSPAPGDWNSIEFQNNANVGSVFNYCIVQYGGGGSSVADVSFATNAFGVPITNCTIQSSSTNGINLRAASPNIKNTVILANTSYGVFSDIFTFFSMDSSTVRKNTQGGIRVPLVSYPTVTNSTVDSNGVGIYVDNSAYPTIKNNVIGYNTIGIQYAAPGSTPPSITNNTFTGNTNYAFQNNSSLTIKAERNYWGSPTGPYHPSLNPTGLGDKVSDYVDFQPWNSGATLPVTQITSSISVNTLWSTGVYWVKNSITLNSPYTLTINPGVVVKFASGARLTVNGTILAAGKSDSLIIFTSDKDDSYGGDTNGDTTATGPNAGDWDELYLNGGGNGSSVLSYCIFKFGNTNIEIDNVAANTFSNVFSSNAKYDGLYLYSSNTYIYQSTFSGNGRYGILGGNTSQAQIRKATILSNTSNGINFDGTSMAVVSLDSSTISSNGGIGVYCYNNTASEAFTNSTFASNTGGGLWSYNLTGTITISGNSFTNNVGDGITTSKASINNNSILGNRYPICLIQRVGSFYSGNTITGNQYNNAIALRANRESLSDTLKRVFPAGITSKTYVMIERSAIGVLAGTTLVVDSGVVVKMNPGIYFDVRGTLTMNSTPTSPIVFTSYRDATYGGKTNLASDTAGPKPNDWSDVEFDNNPSAGSNIHDCIFKYGGTQLQFSSIGSLTNQVSNVISRKAYYQGIYIYGSLVTFNNVTVDSNATTYAGIQASGSGSAHSEVTVRYSTIQDNNGPGLYADGTSSFVEVSNSTIQRNGGNGISVGDASVPEVILANVVSNNGGSGIVLNSSTLDAQSMNLIGNTIANNAGDGVVSSKAWFRQNTIQGNRYAIAVWGRLGNIYKDNSNNDLNVITGNTYNNAVAMRVGVSLSDTLKRVFPAGITSKTYVMIERSAIGVLAGTTLVVDSGVVVKMNPGIYFDVRGTLTMNSTPTSPIVFTSYRDATYGGKTNLASDTAGPKPNDWSDVEFDNNPSAGSNIHDCIFKYGGTQLQFSSIGSLTNQVSNVISRKAYYQGIYIYGSLVTFNNVTVDSNATTYAGIQASGSGSAHSEVTVRYSTIQDNNGPGLYADGTSSFVEVSHSAIQRNKGIGIYVAASGTPMNIVQNNISFNQSHGIYVLAQNDAIDTLLIISGNNVRNNSLIGIASSRALISSDSITGNRYPIGVIGQISLIGGTFGAGNVYSNNSISGNTFNNVIATEGTIVGVLGGSFPAAFGTKSIAARANVTVANSTTLTVAPGTVVKFPNESGSTFRVNGVLKCEGTTVDKIVFTSWKDDSFGGDSNNDSTGSVPSPNDWYGIYLAGSENNTSHILNTIVRYGQYNLDIENTNAPVDSSFLSYGYYYGVYFYNSNSSVTGCEIHHNPTGVYAVGSSNPVVTHNNIHDNTQYGLNNTTNNTINAQFNYWGAASGPFVNQGSPQNLTGTGDRIGINPGAVNYQSWLTSRSGVLLGDVSGNGTIAAYDASLVLQYLVSSITLSSQQLAASDVTADGTVSPLDASYILRYAVGIITGFPGLGKRSSTAAIADSYDFKTEQTGTSGEFAVVVHVKGGTPIYGSQLNLQFDQNELSLIQVAGTVLSDSLTTFSKIQGGKVSVAMAGVNPLTGGGDLIKLLFKPVKAVDANWQSSIQVTRFVLNEQDLSQSAKDIQVNTLTVRGVPTSYGLSQNYPNPFNPTTTIEYQMPGAGNVSVRIYDILGREVATLVDQAQQPGYYLVHWDGRSQNGQAVSSGVYFYRIQIVSDGQNSFSSIKRMVLLK